MKVINLYEDREDVTLTTYVHYNSPEIHTNLKRPAILICPGGGYLSCSDREAEPIALAFAAMGYQTFVLRYSVFGEGNGFAMMEKGIMADANPSKNHPVPMREIGMAMAIIKEHSDEWFVDTARVAICGFSAGAHNCAMYSTHWNKPIIADHLGKDRELLRPAACILGYCLSDYVFMDANTANEDPFNRVFFKFANSAFLGTSEVTQEMLAEVSLALHVSDQTPPTYLWATSADSLVPVQHSLRYAHALADNKIPFEMHIFEEGMHGLALSNQLTAMSKTQMLPDAAKWVPLCDAWLQKRFAYDLPALAPFDAMIADGVSF